jgi:hypothetical protein
MKMRDEPINGQEDPDDPIAIFGAGHTATTNTGNLRVYAPEGQLVATFTNDYLAVVSRANARLTIFPKFRLAARDGGDMRRKLAAINRRNAEFWKRRTE